MSGIEALAPVSGAASLTATQSVQNASALAQSETVAGASFGEILTQGLDSVEAKIDRADEMVRAFTLDQNVPVHQVTIALAEASLAVELAMQVRTRVVEAYREVMNTQL